MLSRRFATGRNLRILAYLLEMSTHGGAGHLWIAPLDGFQNALVVNLPSLRSAFDVKDLDALLTQQSNNRVDQRENERIGDRLGQREMEIEIGLDISFGIFLR